MTNVLEKIKGVMGFEEMLEDEDEVMSENIIEEINENKAKRGKVVNIHNAGVAKVMVIKPKEYISAKEIADSIKEKKIVLVNTVNLENKVAQRVVDFISGACYVLGGELQEVESRIYLLTPINTEVINDSKTEPFHKSLFNWNKENEEE